MQEPHVKLMIDASENYIILRVRNMNGKSFATFTFRAVESYGGEQHICEKIYKRVKTSLPVNCLEKRHASDVFFIKK